MATRPKAVIESRNGEEFSPITIAKNVLTDDGQNLHDILSDRKEDMMTPTIENSSSMFKVGQGDNVDYSSNVVNGAYENMVLKGKTMVNCIQESSSKDIVLPYEFEDGQYVTINDTKESGALGVELKGQTLVNIHKLNTPSLMAAEQDWYENLTRASGEVGFDVLSTPAGWRYINAGYLNYQMLKPNTKYLIVFESSQNISSIHFMRGDGLHGLAPSTVPVQNSKAIITTNSQIVANEQILYVNFYAEPNTKVSFKNPMIIEYVEGMENWDISYFTGMTSCKTPILKTVGNNIIKNSSDVYVFENHDDTNTLSTYTQLSLDANYKQMLRGKEVTVSVDAIGENLAPLAVSGPGYNHYGVDINILFEDGTNQWLSLTKGNGIPTNGSFNGRYCITLTVQDKPIKQVATCQLFCRTTVGRLTLTNVQLEIRNANSNYEPYKSSVLSLPEEVVLRSLPNGTCDTLNLNTGVYTQRIGEKLYDGSQDEGWFLYAHNIKDQTLENAICYQIDVADMFIQWGNKKGICCDKLQYDNNSFGDMIESTYWGLATNVISRTNGRLVVCVDKANAETEQDFRNWLSQNPVTVQYQLATPIVRKLTLPSTLKSWNATTHIYSEVPENTLYPILSHLNPTYPVILKPSTKYSIVANSYSNNHTNSAINFNLGGATASTIVDKHVTTITTPSTLSNELLTMSGRGNKLNNVMIIEGDVVGDEPYFEGICDVKSPILSNVGKNLFDINNHTESQWSFSSGYPYEQNTSYGDRLKILGDEIHFSTDGGTVNKGVGYYIPLCKNKDYTFRINKKDGNGNYCVKLVLIHSSEYPLKQAIQQHSKFGINNETITSSLEANFNSANYDMCAIYIGGGWESGTQNTRSYVFNNISLIESNQQVEPYKSNTTTFDQKGGKTIVLRSLPSGVCDTLNVETGEYVQRIGEIVLDGSEDWIVNGYTNNQSNVLSYFSFRPNNLNCILNQRDGGLSSKFHNIDCASSPNNEGWQIYDSQVRVNVLKSKLSEDSVVGFKRWLSQNPTTVQYELETPIVSTIDVQGFPYAYENGHVQLSSGSIEQSLIPKVEYSVATNRSGQIRSNQKMVERHQKQLDRLQAMILTNLVNTQYEQTLTNLKYDLKNVREEVK